MSNIPSDIFDRVEQLETAIVNASAIDDQILHDALCVEFRVYYDEQVCSGRSHPFLAEAMADFTDDPEEAANLYLLSIEQSMAFPDEPTHTKKVCLARELLRLGEPARATHYLRDGRAEAEYSGDDDWVEEADELLRQLGA
jgi:hypothetical protein